MIDELEHRLRHELQGVLVAYDAARADEMTRIATQAALLGARRRWQAPLAAAAAVAVVGGGAAALAANTGGGSEAPAGTAPSTAASTPKHSSGTGSCLRTDTIQTCLTKLGCASKLRMEEKGGEGPVTLKPVSLKVGDKVVQVIGRDHTITCGVVGK